MCHTSPATFLVWAVISTMLGAFLIFHLWSFDRFQCLKWNNGSYSGAFKRIMTYSYIASVPLLITYSSGFAIIKYREGFITLDFFGVVPKPYQLWSDSSRNALIPLMLTFAVSWSLEMVTHLEELCFWLFLVNAGTGPQDWFRSRYFRIWVVGSVIAVVFMPSVTALTRSDPLKCEAYTFLAGSVGSLCVTLLFLPILLRFPRFLRSLKSDGVDNATITRLTTFLELNTIRVVCRLLMLGPLLILGIDGLRPHPQINEHMLWTDFLTVMSGLGCVISSALTLVIFFPRSIEGEIANREAARNRKHSRLSFGSGFTTPVDFDTCMPPQSIIMADRTSAMTTLRPNRRSGQQVELGGVDVHVADHASTHSNVSIISAASSNTPMVHSFISPINVSSPRENILNDSRLTFNV